jgi:protein-S-isoprenylcysteine O-methyltransferase Ste14
MIKAYDGRRIMELSPTLQLGWLNGWILLVFEFLIQGSLLLIIPRRVVARLFDRSGWSKSERAFLLIGKIFSLACLVLICFSPLITNTYLFSIGLTLYFIGIAGLVASMVNFKDTPADMPVTRGVYKYSRHPQIVSLFVIFLGILFVNWLVDRLVHVGDVQDFPAFRYPGGRTGLSQAL